MHNREKGSRNQNVIGLHSDEYEQFIADPYACMLDVILPRLYKEMNFSLHGGRSCFALAQGGSARNAYFQLINMVVSRMFELFGYYQAPAVASGAAYACMDYSLLL